MATSQDVRTHAIPHMRIAAVVRVICTLDRERHVHVYIFAWRICRRRHAAAVIRGHMLERLIKGSIDGILRTYTYDQISG